MKYLSFDLETIPQDKENLTESQKVQYTKKIAGLDPEKINETMVRSTDPFLGRILAIGMHYKNTFSNPQQEEVKALMAPTADDEKTSLLKFWGVIEKLEPGTKILTFNGFNFDIPWIRIRSMVHGIKIPHCPIEFFNVNPFKNTPHVDLMVAIKNDKFLKNISFGLGLACDMFGIPSPKDGIDGSHVYEEFLAGNIDKIEAYVKRDCTSNGRLYEKLKELNYGI